MRGRRQGTGLFPGADTKTIGPHAVASSPPRNPDDTLLAGAVVPVTIRSDIGPGSVIKVVVNHAATATPTAVVFTVVVVVAILI